MYIEGRVGYGADGNTAPGYEIEGGRIVEQSSGDRRNLRAGDEVRWCRGQCGGWAHNQVCAGYLCGL